MKKRGMALYVGPEMVAGRTACGVVQYVVCRSTGSR